MRVCVCDSKWGRDKVSFWILSKPLSLNGRTTAACLLAIVCSVSQCRQTTHNNTDCLSPFLVFICRHDNLRTFESRNYRRCCPLEEFFAKSQGNSHRPAPSPEAWNESSKSDTWEIRWKSCVQWKFGSSKNAAIHLILSLSFYLQIVIGISLC